MGSLYLEERDLAKAEEHLLPDRRRASLETRARIKLGKVYVLQGRAGEGLWSFFEPMIAGMLKKQKEDQGHRAARDRPQRRASLSRSRKAGRDLQGQESQEPSRGREQGHPGGGPGQGPDREDVRGALAELLELRPRDKDLIREYREVKKETRLFGRKDRRGGRRSRPSKRKRRISTFSWPGSISTSTRAWSGMPGASWKI